MFSELGKADHRLGPAVAARQVVEPGVHAAGVGLAMQHVGVEQGDELAVAVRRSAEAGVEFRRPQEASGHRRQARPALHRPRPEGQPLRVGRPAERRDIDAIDLGRRPPWRSTDSRRRTSVARRRSGRRRRPPGRPRPCPPRSRPATANRRATGRDRRRCRAPRRRRGSPVRPRRSGCRRPPSPAGRCAPAARPGRRRPLVPGSAARIDVGHEAFEVRREQAPAAVFRRVTRVEKLSPPPLASTCSGVSPPRSWIRRQVAGGERVGGHRCGWSGRRRGKGRNPAGRRARSR